MSREIMQQALDALKQTFQFQQTRDVIAALEAELAKPEQDTHCKYCNGIGCVTCDARCLPEQEPKLTDAGADTNIDPFTLYPKGSGMVTMNQPEQDINILHIGTDVIEEGMHLIVRRGNEIIHSQFYEAPKRQWVGLTDDDVVACWARPDMFAIAHAIESKLKEKNS